MPNRNLHLNTLSISLNLHPHCPYLPKATIWTLIPRCMLPNSNKNHYLYERYQTSSGSRHHPSARLLPLFMAHRPPTSRQQPRALAICISRPTDTWVKQTSMLMLGNTIIGTRTRILRTTSSITRSLFSIANLPRKVAEAVVGPSRSTMRFPPPRC